MKQSLTATVTVFNRIFGWVSLHTNYFDASHLQNLRNLDFSLKTFLKIGKMQKFVHFMNWIEFRLLKCISIYLYINLLFFSPGNISVF